VHEIFIVVQSLLHCLVHWFYHITHFQVAEQQVVGYMRLTSSH